VAFADRHPDAAKQRDGNSRSKGNYAGQRSRHRVTNS
jgi:hypothetical protein